MSKDELLNQIKDSYTKYFQDIFSKSLNFSQGNFSTFIENVSEEIPLQQTTKKISEKFFMSNIQPKQELLSGGSLLFSLEQSLFAFVYSVKIANEVFDGFISNIPNFAEDFDEIKKALITLEESVQDRSSKMISASLTNTELVIFGLTETISSGSTISTKSALLLELFLLTKMGEYEFKHSYPVLDLFVEEAYVSIAAPILKACRSSKKYKMGQLRSMVNFNIVSTIKDSFKNNKELKEAFIEYKTESIFSVIFQRVDKLLESLKDSIKED